MSPLHAASQGDPFLRTPAGQEARDSTVGPAMAVATRAKAAKMVKACMIFGFAGLAFVVGLAFEFLYRGVEFAERMGNWTPYITDISGSYGTCWEE